MERNDFGFLAIDKPAGLTSHDCVNRLRKIYGIKRIGHGGTLDPAVTGVLPFAIGKATKLLSFLPNSKKYEGTINLGIRTSTDDLEGEVISKQSWPKLNKQTISEHLNNFQGLIQQSPPRFSSVHIKGERAYKKARRGENFKLPSREIIIHQLQFSHWDQSTGKLKIKVHCSSGTYIRALARDIGERIGCGGTLAELRRTEALGFNINKAISLPEFNKSNAFLKPTLTNPIKALNHLASVELTINEISSWSKGQAIIIKANRIKTIATSENKLVNLPSKYILVVSNNRNLLGIGILHLDPVMIQPKIVFNAVG